MQNNESDFLFAHSKLEIKYGKNQLLMSLSFLNIILIKQSQITSTEDTSFHVELFGENNLLFKTLFLFLSIRKLKR